ncbi:MAG: nuclear transport factor 2 family protein [Burkholderiales bacterium]
MFATADEAEHAFYDALERADVNRLAQVWADDEEIVCVHPGGLRIVGHHAVLQSWHEILSGGGLRIQPSMLVTLHSMMSAVHSLVETISIRSEGAAEIAHCYATNVYHKGPTGWRLVMHHASAAPVDAGMLDLNDVPGLLH